MAARAAQAGAGTAGSTAGVGATRPAAISAGLSSGPRAARTRAMSTSERAGIGELRWRGRARGGGAGLVRPDVAAGKPDAALVENNAPPGTARAASAHVAG